MRYVYIALIVAFAGIVALFKIQNLEVVTVSLFSMSMTMPTSVLVLLIYLLGMLTGGFVLAALRSWMRGATARNG
jgi:uncharacterized integral membrane protein